MIYSVFREDGLPLVRDVEWGADSWRRARGLIGAASLGMDHGLVLTPCRAIHTGFMRFALDVIFFSRAERVVRMAARVKPFRVVWGGWPAWGVLEMQSGWFPLARLKEGDKLLFRSRQDASSVER
ncbi:MAG: DUF192 domain-containing protein [Kiritimatiellae bacterium]|nr:DUF192 domain-containing protein [Kiritimatiellia bacterium]